MTVRRTTAAKRSTATPVETESYELIAPVCFAGEEKQAGDTVDLSAEQAEFYRQEKLIASDGEAVTDPDPSTSVSSTDPGEGAGGEGGGEGNGEGGES